MTTPLHQLKIIELGHVIAGPLSAALLSDFGADVIKIEAPTKDTTGAGAMGGARHGSDFQNLQRNKRSMTLNLKSPEGLEVFRKLAAGADIIVENYRPDVKFRLGIDYESLKPINPGLIYASISGFGQDGPLAGRPGFDQIGQGMGGLMSITGEPGRGPMRVGIPIADLCAGLFAAQGIMAGAYDIAIAAGVEVMSLVPMGASLMVQGVGTAFTQAMSDRYADVGGLVP